MQLNKLAQEPSPSSEIKTETKHEPILISIFTQKGGVGKTTSVLNIASLLADEHAGKNPIKILLVDGDPQCNLTAICLKRAFLKQHEEETKKEGLKDEVKTLVDNIFNQVKGEGVEDEEKILSDKLEKFYAGDENFTVKLGDDDEEEKSQLIKTTVTNNLFRALMKIKDLGMTPIEVAKETELQQLKELAPKENLYLLPSSLDLYNIDHALTILTESSQVVKTSTSVVFDPAEYIREVGRRFKFDLIFIDLSPNVGGLNQSLLLCSDYFMMPGDASFFTMQSVFSIARALPGWVDNYSRAWARKPGTTKSTPMPLANFLNLYVQKVKYSSEVPTVSYQSWINKIEKAVRESLVPVLINPRGKFKKPNLKEYSMTIPDKDYGNLPVINQMDRSLQDADKLGLPITSMNSAYALRIIRQYNVKQKKLKGEKIKIPNKNNIERYKREFRRVIQSTISTIARIDSRMRASLKFQFIPDNEKIAKQFEKFLVDIRKSTFITLLNDELATKRIVSVKPHYPLTLTNIVKLLYSLRMKLNKQKNKDTGWTSLIFGSKNLTLSMLTYPHLLPEDKQLKEFEKQLTLEINTVKNIKPYALIVPFYYQLTWIIFKINLDKKNKKLLSAKIIQSQELIFTKLFNLENIFDSIKNVLSHLKLINKEESIDIKPEIVTLKPFSKKIPSKKSKTKESNEEKEKYKHLIPFIYDDMKPSDKLPKILLKKRKRDEDTSKKAKNYDSGVILERLLPDKFQPPKFSKERDEYFQALHECFINDLTAEFTKYSKDANYQNILKKLTEQRLYQLGKKSSDLVKIIILVSVLEMLKQASSPTFDENAIIGFLHNLFVDLKDENNDIEIPSDSDSDKESFEPKQSDSDCNEADSANRDRRYWYSIEEINILLTKLRSEFLFNREDKTGEHDPFRDSRENNQGIYLANAFYVVNPLVDFKPVLTDQILTILGEHKTDQRFNRNKWQTAPTVMILPVLYTGHWHVVRVILNPLAGTANILWDDPFGQVHFPALLKVGMSNAFKQLLPRLLNYKNTNRPPITELEQKSFIEFNKLIDQQGTGRNGWDCGPIVISNITDYLRNPLRSNRDFSSTAQHYTIGLSTEIEHDNKIVARRIVDFHSKNRLQDLKISDLEAKKFKDDQQKHSAHLSKQAKAVFMKIPDGDSKFQNLNNPEAMDTFFGILQSLRTDQQIVTLEQYDPKVLLQAYEQTVDIMKKLDPLPKETSAKKKQKLSDLSLPSVGGMFSSTTTARITRSTVRQNQTLTLNLGL